ncbi:MAG: response regulator [Magnetospirillum sp. WYHS-4]
MTTVRSLFSPLERERGARFLVAERDAGYACTGEGGVLTLAHDLRRDGSRQPVAGMRPIRVLLADESPGERRLIQAILDELPLAVDLAWADSGEGALAHFGNGGMNGFRHHPDVLLIDPVLPGLDGWEVIARLRRDDDLADLRIAVMAPQPSDYMVRRCRELGVDAILEKPVTGTALDILLGRLANDR